MQVVDMLMELLQGKDHEVLYTAFSQHIQIIVALTTVVLVGSWLLSQGGSNASSSTNSNVSCSELGYVFKCGQKAEEPSGEVGSQHIGFQHERLPLGVSQRRAVALLQLMQTRRSLRFFSNDPVPLKLIETCVKTAATAPSGAHLQPWTFVIVTSREKKAQIRELVEAQEKVNYERRMSRKWVADVNHLVDNLHGDSVRKPYLEDAPALIVVMKQPYGLNEDGTKQEHYYAEESTGIACGMLITALHNANLVTLTSTPLGAEAKIRDALGRPENEKVYLLMPVGYPSKDATVPYRSPMRPRKDASKAMVIVQ